MGQTIEIRPTSTRRRTCIRSVMAVAVTGMVLAGCSTTVTEAPTPGASAQSGQAVTVRSVHGTASATGTPNDLVLRLTDAIKAEVNKLPARGKPVDLEFNVVDYKAVSGGARAIAGMLAGSNRLHTVITLHDEGGAAVRQFDVDRKANPGGLGAVTDQQSDLINSTAKAVAQSLAK